MLFALWAMAYTWIWSGLNQLNRYWQLPGRVLTYWRLYIPAVVFIPVTFFVPAPTDPIYWIAVLTSAAMVPIHDARMFDVSARYGGQVAFRLRSLVLPMVFVLWLVLRPDYYSALLASPWIASGIILCLCLVIYFMFRLNRCTVTRAALLDMMPVILAGIAFEITNKTAMDHAAFPANMIYYIFVVSGAPFLLSFFVSQKKTNPMLYEMANIPWQGLAIGLITILSMASKNMAMIYTPNPAYVTAITLTAPFWISLYLKIRGEKEEADWVAGSGLVISIIIMTLLAAYLPH